MSSDVQRPGEIRLLVRGIGRGVAITDVAELFAPFGVDPARIALPRDRRTRRRKGIAFVVAPNAALADFAIQTLNETTFHEKPITVEVAEEAPPRRGRGRPRR
jgi:RNA recognition motif-containing protein